MGQGYRVRLGCSCGKGPVGAPAAPQPEPVVTGIEGETGAAQ